MRPFEQTCTAFYKSLEQYQSSRGASITAARINNYFEMWNDLHKSTVNISKDGWKALFEVMKRFGLDPSRQNAEVFLFSVETYLDALMKMVALNRMGQVIGNSQNFQTLLQNTRSSLPANVLEWYFDAINDGSLRDSFRKELEQSLNLLAGLLDTLDFTITSFDVFREIYQNILPREVRRSLGEFYTSESIIEQVLLSAGINSDKLHEIYKDWKNGHDDITILDLSCGSGSFLVVIIRQIVRALRGQGISNGEILRFIQKSVIGIDVNPFAVDMARLNYLLTTIETLNLTPAQIPVFWADSLTRIEPNSKIPRNKSTYGVHDKYRIPVGNFRV